MCLDEVTKHVDSVVTGEAESGWAQVLEDVRHGRLKRRYDGGLADVAAPAPARHDLLPARYAFGAIQTTRGCPLNCHFCSVTTFNGAQYRQQPIPDVVREFQSIREKRVLVVDDNLIGTRTGHIARALAVEPQLILYDEPTSGLDPISAVAIAKDIVNLNERIHATSVVVPHDRDRAFGVANRIAVMDDGEILTVGTPDEVRRNSDPRVEHFLNAHCKRTENNATAPP